MKIKNSPRKILSVLILALAMTLATIFSIGALADEEETYTAAVDNAITGGVLTLSSGETTGDTVTVAAGDAVTVTVTPEEGKQLVAGSLKFTTEGGGSVTDNVYGDAPEDGVDTTIPVTDNEGSFTMPASNVLVTAQFEELEAPAPEEPAQPQIVKTGDPAKLVYQEGEVFDLTGFSAKVAATDGSETPVAAEDISVDKTEPLTADDKEIIITVAPESLEPVAFDYTIEVVESPLGFLVGALGAPEGFVPVTGITLSTTQYLSGSGYMDLNPLATVTPEDATNKTITWALKTDGTNTCSGSFNGTRFRATAGGTCEVTATIADGLAPGIPYTQDFTIMSNTPFSMTATAPAYDPSDRADLIQTATVTWTLTAPSNQAIYGFRTTILYPTADYMSLDLDKLKSDNASLGPEGHKKPLLINGEVGAGLTHSQSDTSNTLDMSYDWIGVESDGVNPIIPAGGSVDIKLTFKFSNYTPATPAGSKSVLTGEYLSTSGTDRMLVLFTDSTARLSDLVADENKTARQKLDVLRDQVVTNNNTNGPNTKILWSNPRSITITTVAPTPAKITISSATGYDKDDNVLTALDVTKEESRVHRNRHRAAERARLRLPHSGSLSGRRLSYARPGQAEKR